MQDRKAAARKAAFARRKSAKTPQADQALAEVLSTVLAPHRGEALAGYMPIRTEANPLPVMAQMARHGPVGVPVIDAPATPLRFRIWGPDAPMVDGAFGALIPAQGAWMTPRVVLVPLVAFDASGGRLGYGGGFYDRTLEMLRARGPITAYGLAFDAQEAADLPLEPTDQPLDGIITESGRHLR